MPDLPHARIASDHDLTRCAILDCGVPLGSTYGVLLVSKDIRDEKFEVRVCPDCYGGYGKVPIIRS